MRVDFRRPSKSVPPILIKKFGVERVSTYKYLGSVIDEILAWTAHVDNIIKRLNSRMFCLRKLERFGVRTDILKLFLSVYDYGCMTLLLILLGWEFKKTDIDRLNDIMKRAERVVGVGLAPVDSVYQELLVRKLCQVCKDAEHPLHDALFDRGRVRGRLRLPPLNKNRHRDSFIPRAINYTTPYTSNYKKI